MLKIINVILGQEFVVINTNAENDSILLSIWMNAKG